MFTGFMGRWYDIRYIPAILCVVFLGTIVIIEITNLINNKLKKVNKLKDFFQEQDIKLSDTFPKFNLASLHEEKSKTKWVLYDNYICDVGNYITSHPGGANTIEENLYSDMSRFMTGTQAYSSGIEAYDHNIRTVQLLIDKMCYGVLKDSHNIIFKKGSTPMHIAKNTESASLHESPSEYISESYVHLVSKQEIAENIFQYKFKSQKGMQFAKILPGVYSLGRHYSLSSLELNKTRYYSISMCLSEEIKRKHFELIQNVKKIESGLEVVNVEIPEDKMYCDEFNLYIKKYNFKNGLSGYVVKFNDDMQTDLIIRGPVGTGLNLFNNIRGTNVIFAAGTGIIPFIDLIAFTVRYVTYQICKNEFKGKENLILNKEKTIFDSIKEHQFKICLFATFSSPLSALYMDICEALSALDSKYNMNIFKLHIKNSNGEKWDKEFVGRNLSEEKGKVEKVFIVGPVSFMENVEEAVIESGLAAKETIVKV